MLKLIPALLSLLILAAHFYRAEIFWLAVFMILVIFLIFVKANWVPPVMQIILILGTLEWVRTAFVLIYQRQELGQPWLRMTIILAAVALLTFISFLIFRSKTIIARYQKAAG